MPRSRSAGTWNGQRIGAIGDFVSFSFHPNKNVTTIEGGALVLNDEREAKLAEQYRLQGVVRSGFDGMEVELVGGKFNLTDVAARVGLGQLPRLDEFQRQSSRAGARLLRAVRPAGGAGAGPAVAGGRFRADQLAHVSSRAPEARLAIKRAEVMAQLHAAGIGTGVHYPAIHLFGGLPAARLERGRLPLAEANAAAFSRCRCSHDDARPTPPVWSTRCRDSHAPPHAMSATLVCPAFGRYSRLQRGAELPTLSHAFTPCSMRSAGATRSCLPTMQRGPVFRAVAGAIRGATGCDARDRF